MRRLPSQRPPSLPHAALRYEQGHLITPVWKVLPPTLRPLKFSLPPGAALARPVHPALTLDGAEAPALVLAVVLGGGTPQVPVLAACAGAAVEPLVVILEGDGAWLPVGVPLDGVDLCRKGASPLASGPQRLSASLSPQGLSPIPGAGDGAAPGGASGFKAPSAVR